MTCISSGRGKKVDLAAVSLAALGAAVLFAIILQFVLWLKVRFEHKASVLEWKGVIENAIKDVEAARQTFDAFREAQARLEASNTALSLKQTALEESFAHFNAKTIARAREEAKSARRQARSAEADADAGGEAAGAEAGAESRAAAIAAALAEQQALGLPGAADGPAAGRPPRLRIKRFGT